MHDNRQRITRRHLLAHTGPAIVAAATWCGSSPRATAQTAPNAPAPQAAWFEAAEAMKRLALSWGDQPYGAVLVVDGKLVGAGPSRVVKHNDPNAHAEREAIRDAQHKLGRHLLEGSLLVSTSRPCSACEAAAAQAGVARMLFGPQLTDAGAPQARQRP
jgi:tRNA(adenine34) deaminase